MQVRRTTTKYVSPISRNMGVNGFIIEFWLVIRTDNYTRSSLPAPLICSFLLLFFFFLTDLAQLHSLIALQQFMRGLGEEMNETELVGKNIHDRLIKGSVRGDRGPNPPTTTSPFSVIFSINFSKIKSIHKGDK